MDLFTYLMAKNGNNSSVHGDLFSYLLGKGQSQIYTVSGTTIYIPNAKKLVSFMMTKESTQDGTPTPDNPVEVKTVKGYSNLFDENTLYHYTYDTSSGKVIKRNDRNSYVANVKPNTDYVISRSIATSVSRVAFLENFNSENEYTYISLLNISSNLTYNITTPQNCNYIMFLTGDSVASNLMLIEGDQKLPYVPYGNNYIAVNVSDGTNTNSYPIPLMGNEIVGIGDYKDELIVDKSGNVYLNKVTDKYTFTGSETVSLLSYNTGGYLFQVTSKTFPISNYSTNYMNNYSVANSTSTSSTQVGSYFFNGVYRLRVPSTIATSGPQYKAWLSTANNTIYYPLEEPELIDLQTTVDLKLFKGVNNLSNSEDGYMTIEYH